MAEKRPASSRHGTAAWTGTKITFINSCSGNFRLQRCKTTAKASATARTLERQQPACNLIREQHEPLFRSNTIVKLAWHFSKVNPRFKNREATQGEFFASDTELRGFVREAVQNSLDARRPGHNGPVAVRIFLSGERLALPRETSKRYFRGGWEHFGSESSGLRAVSLPA